MPSWLLPALLVSLLWGCPPAHADRGAARPKKTRPISGIKVVNVGGPLDNVDRARYRRPDFRHVDLRRGRNTTVADINTASLRAIFGEGVRILRASNVPFSSVDGGWVRPSRFVKQAEELGVEKIIATTGTKGRKPLKQALRRAGWSVEVRRMPRRALSEPWYIIVGRPPAAAPAPAGP